MTTWYGWAGTILRVDLSTGKIVKQPLTEELAHSFVGGRGINSRILYDETSSQTDPLGPDNRLIVGTGPVTGTLGPSAGRFNVTARSPLTGILGDGNGGGDFAAELKFAGYDHIVFQGQAQQPVYLWIDDDQVQLRDATHLWGKNTWETEELLRKELGDSDVKTMCIGQAGENLVRFACPIATDDRTPGRTGLGAVMGSKKLKAIAVRGSQSVRVADPKAYQQCVWKWYTDLEAQSMRQVLATIGTANLVRGSNEQSHLRIKNGQELHWPEEKIAELYGENMVAKYGVRSLACFGCPTHCEKFSVVKEGRYAGEKGLRPEGASLYGAGPNIGLADFPFNLKATNTLNQYGLDTFETGTAIAAAMEWYQRGIISGKDTDGLELEWGNQDAVLELYRKIATRDGFGNLLAEGEFIAAQKIGKGADQYVHGSKGMSTISGAFEDSPGTILSFSMSTRGLDHLRGTAVAAMVRKPAGAGLSTGLGPTSYDPSYAELEVHTEDVCTAADMMEVCKFNTEWWGFDKRGTGGLARMAELLSALTGVDFTEERLRQAAERVYHLEKAYLVRMGMRREDDNPSSHHFGKALKTGPYKGWSLDKEKFEALKDVYYDARGWDRATGAPRKEKLEELGLKNVAQDLDKIGVYKKG